MAEVRGEAGVKGGAHVGPVSLFVADLEHSVDDALLYEVFNQIGQVNSVRVCRDVNTRSSLGYGYVNYSDAKDGMITFRFS